MESKFIEKAFKELGEDESKRNQALEQFREWLEKHKFLSKVRQDDIHLLKFLRVRKFNMISTLKNFEKFHLSPKTFAEFMDFSGENFNKMIKIYDSGYCFPLSERDSKGRRIIFTRPKFWDTEAFSPFDVIRSILFVCLIFLEEEETQIAGISFVADLNGITTQHLFTPTIAIKIIQIMTNSLPIRFNDFLFVNMPVFAKWILDFFLSRMKEKIISRFFFVDSIGDIKNHIDEKLLPKEYGGEKSCEEILVNFKKLLEERREKVLSSFSADIDWSKVKEDERALFTGDEGVGSFRKLQID